MNLPQSDILPHPSPWFVPYPYAYRPPEPPQMGSHQEKVLRFLYRHRGRPAFGSLQRGHLFPEIGAAVGNLNTLGAALTRLKRRGYVACEVKKNKTKYWITELGICAL